MYIAAHLRRKGHDEAQSPLQLHAHQLPGRLRSHSRGCTLYLVKTSAKTTKQAESMRAHGAHDAQCLHLQPLFFQAMSSHAGQPADTPTLPALAQP
jgi:hypothetical protein